MINFNNITLLIMKTKLYLMGAALVMLASVSFTACSDDDEPQAVTTPDELTVPSETKRIKIGDEFRLPLSEVTLAGAGEYHAYSLNPEVADVETDADGSRYIAGYKNGTADIVLSDAAGRYKKVAVAVYTTEVMKLAQNAVFIKTLPGQTMAVTGLSVAEGNGGYTVESSLPSYVGVSINAETGEFQITAVPQEEPYTAVVTVSDQSALSAEVNISVDLASDRVKIGADTREPLPVDPAKGEYTAESLDENYATVVDNTSIEGLKNGKARIKIVQGETVYQYTYSIYTTDVLKLTQDELTFSVPMGLSSSNTAVSVAEGNGEYTVTSDNPDVTASISYTTGQLTINATSRKAEYTATLTISDCTGLTAELKVIVSPTYDPFTQDDINEILAITENKVFGQVKDPSDGTEPYYMIYYTWYGYGTWFNSVENSKRTVGWWMNMWGSDYGGLTIEFPADAEVDTEVNGTLAYQYSTSVWYPKYTYDGTVKMLEDNDQRTVTIFWNVDMENERINRGYVVVYK